MFSSMTLRNMFYGKTSTSGYLKSFVSYKITCHNSPKKINKLV